MNTVFTKIINGELSGRPVYRGDEVVAFLITEPVMPDHTLIVSAEEADKRTDASPELWAHLNEVAQRVGQAIVSAFDAPRAGCFIAGFRVPHTHIHVFPAHDMSGYNLQSTDRNLSAESMDEAAARLREALGTDEDRKLVH